MGLHSYYSALGAVSALLLIVVIVDQFYQRFSHKWTNEPPLLPYRIPIVGHALMFNSACTKLYKTAQYVFAITLSIFWIYAGHLCSEHFPDCKPYSLMFFGKRVYVRSLIILYV